MTAPTLPNAPHDAALKLMHPLKSHDQEAEQAKALALVTDPARSLITPLSERRMAWAILVAARGGFCRQIEMIRHANALGLTNP